MSNAPTAKEIRLFCDGELSLPQAAAIEQSLREHPDAGALAGFERDLKKQVAAVLKDGSAPPAGLTDRIRAALAAQRDAAAPAAHPAPHPAPHPAMHPATHRAMHRAWWQAPLRANAFAVAASLVLVAGAVLFGIFGQPIDAWRGQSVLDIGSEAAAAVAEEHVAAAGRPDGPLRYGTPEVAARELAPYLGEAGCVYDLSDLGYSFVGGDTCAVPDCERGCHLVYRRDDGGPGAITLHVVPSPDQLQSEGTIGLDGFPLRTDKFVRDANCRMDVLVWSHGNRWYLLCACIPGDTEKVALRMQERLVSGSR